VTKYAATAGVYPTYPALHSWYAWLVNLMWSLLGLYQFSQHMRHQGLL